MGGVRTSFWIREGRYISGSDVPRPYPSVDLPNSLRHACGGEALQYGSSMTSVLSAVKQASDKKPSQLELTFCASDCSSAATQMVAHTLQVFSCLMTLTVSLALPALVSLKVTWSLGAFRVIHVPVMKSPSGWGMSSFTWIVKDQSAGVVFHGFVMSKPEMDTLVVAFAWVKELVQSSNGMSLTALPPRKVCDQGSSARVVGRRVVRRRAVDARINWGLERRIVNRGL